MSRIRLTQRTAARGRMADGPTPESPIDLGKNRTYRRMDQYHNFEPKKNHWIPDMDHEWKRDQTEREPTNHGKLRAEQVFAAAKKATKLAMMFLGAGASDADIENQARAFMRMGDRAMTASIDRWATVQCENGACATEVVTAGKKDGGDDKEKEEEKEKKTEGEGEAKKTEGDDADGIAEFTDTDAEGEGGEGKSEGEAKKTEGDDDDDFKVEVDPAPAEGEDGAPVDDLGKSLGGEGGSKKSEGEGSEGGDPLEDLWKDEGEGGEGGEEPKKKAPEEEAPTEASRKAGVKKLCGQPTLSRVASVKSDDLTSLWDKWSDPTVSR